MSIKQTKVMQKQMVKRYRVESEMRDIPKKSRVITLK